VTVADEKMVAAIARTIEEAKSSPDYLEELRMTSAAG